MDSFPRMLYKAGGTEEIHGGRFSTLIVDNDDELDAALAEGWSMTTTEALEASKRPAPAQDDKAPPTRAELETKATDLGIKFDGRTGDRKLGELIEAALKG